MNTPDKLDNHVQEKFRRDKSEITKMMHRLDEEIRILFFYDFRSRKL